MSTAANAALMDRRHRKVHRPVAVYIPYEGHCSTDGAIWRLRDDSSDGLRFGQSSKVDDWTKAPSENNESYSLRSIAPAPWPWTDPKQEVGNAISIEITGRLDRCVPLCPDQRTWARIGEKPGLMLEGDAVARSTLEEGQLRNRIRI